MAANEEGQGSSSKFFFDSFMSEWPQVEEKALVLLQELLRIDTQNYGEDCTETEAVKVIQERFDASKVDYEVVEPKPGRGNIIARIKGDGSSGRGPILLSSHLDTVKAPKENWEAEGWKHNPYGGEIDEEDGCLYGRGAIDMKHMAAMCVMILCFIKDNGIQLSRDLIFAGLADEERVDSTYGVKYLVENRPELIEADVVITEVGGISLHNEGKEMFSVMIGEKASSLIKITAKGPGGHASVYHFDNPLGTIGSVANVLSKTPLPLRIVPAGRATIESVSAQLPLVKRVLFRQLLSPTLSNLVAKAFQMEQYQAFMPLLHNTASPTIIEGGNQANQIPSEVSLTVDCRILPGLTVEDVLDDLRFVIGLEKFEPRAMPNGEEMAPELSMEVIKHRYTYSQDPNAPEIVEVVDIIRSVIRERANGAPVITNLLPGGTDLTYYSRHPTKTPVCLGFTPTRFPPGMKLVALFHGVNERIPVDGFKWGVRVLADVVAELCGAKR
ncbi:PREDICTED: aminoacylase-1-like [Amphimedon queenslandica]|uniref:Peptidase M20 dimerisation domain-containing protein n=1 Tax=Amphimedon queenslandica TaxID=400682 RepID=A0A1X7UP77_AMPQE|nr:PREDICTED: aminoacylase-1-like [Amphimedon queenslandica]|eukprot:XP_019853203.1 PREDICTED: aminoacylase-1-like [Amphimedon queenslandica]